MQISNRLPKERPFRKKIKKCAKNKNYKTKNREIIFREQESLCHSKLREMQRYGTSNIKCNKIVKDICCNNSVTIRKNENVIIALVRYSSRYYVAVMDIKLKKIKTFLPDNLPNLLDYVQTLIDKENAKSIPKAA